MRVTFLKVKERAVSLGPNIDYSGRCTALYLLERDSCDQASCIWSQLCPSYSSPENHIKKQMQAIKELALEAKVGAKQKPKKSESTLYDRYTIIKELGQKLIDNQLLPGERHVLAKAEKKLFSKVIHNATIICSTISNVGCPLLGDQKFAKVHLAILSILLSISQFNEQKIQTHLFWQVYCHVRAFEPVRTLDSKLPRQSTSVWQYSLTSKTLFKSSNWSTFCRKQNWIVGMDSVPMFEPVLYLHTPVS